MMTSSQVLTVLEVSGAGGVMTSGGSLGATVRVEDWERSSQRYKGPSVDNLETSWVLPGKMALSSSWGMPIRH